MNRKLNTLQATMGICAICFLMVVSTMAMDKGGDEHTAPKSIGESKTGSTLRERKTETHGRLIRKKPTAAKLEQGQNQKFSKKPAIKSKKKLSEKEIGQCFQEGGWVCFASCLANSVPMDVVITCAEACANGQYSTCATCIGVGIEVVVACGLECLLEVQ